MQLKVLLQTIRPSFLILTPGCIFLGLATSLAAQASLNLFMILLVFIGAISAHISVNAINEYHDFKSGLDFKTGKTPFSGGSGALPEHPEMAGAVWATGLVSLMVTVVTGVYFILELGIDILPVGLLGVVLILTYTRWLNRFPLLCLVAPGLGFGILMVTGTHLILAGAPSQLAWLVSLVPFFLINNLLLLNQYPDIKADSNVGRKTFPIAFGTKRSSQVYAVFLTATYALILLLMVKNLIPGLAIVALAPMLLSLFALSGAIKYAENLANYPRYLAANVAAAIFTPLLLGVSIAFG